MNYFHSPKFPPPYDQCNDRFLLYSRCFGYELAAASFDEDRIFSNFLCSSAGEIISILPEEIDGWLRLEAMPALAGLK